MHRVTCISRFHQLKLLHGQLQMFHTYTFSQCCPYGSHYMKAIPCNFPEILNPFVVNYLNSFLHRYPIFNGPNEWGKFFGDPTLTTATLNLLLHRSEIISFSEEDDRLRMKYIKTLFSEISVQS